jgi:hypothetical protein
MVRKKAQAKVGVKRTVDGEIRTVNPAKKAALATGKARVKAKDKEGKNDRN